MKTEITTLIFLCLFLESAFSDYRLDIFKSNFPLSENGFEIDSLIDDANALSSYSSEIRSYEYLGFSSEISKIQNTLEELGGSHSYESYVASCHLFEIFCDLILEKINELSKDEIEGLYEAVLSFEKFIPNISKGGMLICKQYDNVSFSNVAELVLPRNSLEDYNLYHSKGFNEACGKLMESGPDGKVMLEFKLHNKDSRIIDFYKNKSPILLLSVTRKYREAYFYIISQMRCIRDYGTLYSELSQENKDLLKDQIVHPWVKKYSSERLFMIWLNRGKPLNYHTKI